MNRTIESQGRAAAITRRASAQTYYTVRFLVDRDLVPAAYQAYAYFRWVDDCLDEALQEQSERLAFIERQKALVERCYAGELPEDMTPEERMLAGLIQADPHKTSGLHAYIRNMMEVMAFDAERRGRLITRQELGAYMRSLATAVTEALHYFIGHSCRSPRGAARHLAAMGAHIAHMLRDAYEDNAAGYVNVPHQFLVSHNLDPQDVDSPAYHAWVRGQVGLARAYFMAGKDYLAHVESYRCRLAGHAYIARFEVVLDAIEREGYRLRPRYNERKSPLNGLRVAWVALTRACVYRRVQTPSQGYPLHKPLQREP
jgi:hypothetical protein